MQRVRILTVFCAAVATSLAGVGLFVSQSAAADAAKVPSDRQVREVEGWRVLVSNQLLENDQAATVKALELLAAQLREIKKVVPAPAVAKLQEVTLWFSPRYEGFGPLAEYHPDAGWLREHHRDPAMAQGVEFTDIDIFEKECRRMPNFALHELAHAYHDRVLPKGFENPDIKAAYEQAKASGSYEKVEQRDGDGHSQQIRHYALTNQQEYFAESSEAYFSTNDFYPFNRADLEKHDPRMAALLKTLWQQTDAKK